MTHDIRFGIAAQIALAEFLQAWLVKAQTGWRLVMTEIGGTKDRLLGIDFYLVSPQGISYPLDVSFRDKPDRLVLVMERDWFTRESRKAFDATGQLVVDPAKLPDIARAVARTLLHLQWNDS